MLLKSSPLSLAPFLALHAAALSGHVSTVKLLLENNAQVDATDVMKHTPLFRACEMGHKDVIQTLIKGSLLRMLPLSHSRRSELLHSPSEIYSLTPQRATWVEDEGEWHTWHKEAQGPSSPCWWLCDCGSHFTCLILLHFL